MQSLFGLLVVQSVFWNFSVKLSDGTSGSGDGSNGSHNGGGASGDVPTPIEVATPTHPSVDWSLLCCFRFTNTGNENSGIENSSDLGDIISSSNDFNIAGTPATAREIVADFKGIFKPERVQHLINIAYGGILLLCNSQRASVLGDQEKKKNPIGEDGKITTCAPVFWILLVRVLCRL